MAFVRWPFLPKGLWTWWTKQPKAVSPSAAADSNLAVVLMAVTLWTYPFMNFFLCAGQSTWYIGIARVSKCLGCSLRFRFCVAEKLWYGSYFIWTANFQRSAQFSRQKTTVVKQFREDNKFPENQTPFWGINSARPVSKESTYCFAHDHATEDLFPGVRLAFVLTAACPTSPEGCPV